MNTVQVLMHYHFDRFVEHVRCRRNHYAALVGLSLLALFCLNAAWLFVAERSLAQSDFSGSASQRPKQSVRQVGEPAPSSVQIPLQVSSGSAVADAALSAFARQRMVTKTATGKPARSPNTTVANSTLAAPVAAANGEPRPVQPDRSKDLSVLPLANPFRPIAWSTRPQSESESEQPQGFTLPEEAELATGGASTWELNPPKQVPSPPQPSDPYASPEAVLDNPLAASPQIQIVGRPTLADEPANQMPAAGTSASASFRTAQNAGNASSPQSGSAQSTEASAQPNSAQTPESVGVPPPREQPQFLRRNSVLLKPGNYQWEIGLQYTTNETFTPFGQLVEDTSVVANVRQVNRTLTTPIEFRLGIAEGWQGSVGVPIGWSGSETSLLGFEQTEDDLGFGDFAFSLTKVLREGNADRATLLGLLAVTAPTSDATLASTLLEPGATLGRGFWSLTTGVTALKNFDPLVVFGSAGYLHNFEGDVEDSDDTINAGDGFFYRLGVGFAVNSRVSLNTAFSGAFLDDIEFNDIQRGGTSREPLSLRFAATILQADRVRRENRRSVEPFLNLGLTNSAVDSQFGISWTF